MKKLLLFFTIFSHNVYALTCQDDAIDLNAGDVISADMIKDIFSRISGVSTGMTSEELDGVWSCTSFNRDSDSNDNGYTGNSDGIGSSMSQDITFTKQNDDTFIVTYQNNLGQNSTATPPGNTCKGKLIDGALFIMNPPDTGTCYNVGLYGMRRISKQCFVWEVTNSFPLSSATTCQRKTPAPLAPTSLVATLSSGAVSLSWAAGDASTVSYTLKAKTSATGTYSDVVTDITGTTYTDTLTAGTKWYRVFGVNASGVSTGSNVVSVAAQ